MATGESTTVGGMIAAGMGILRRQPLLIGAFMLLSLIQHVIQFLAVMTMGTTFAPLITIISGIAIFVINVVLLRELMVRERLVTPGAPLQFWTYVGVSIVVGLAVGVGFLLLVVPGFMLLLRWYLAPYFVLARGSTFDEALAASRDATKGHRWAIFAVFLLLGLVYLIFVGAPMATLGGPAAYVQLGLSSAGGLVALVLQTVMTGVTVAVLLGTFAALADGATHFEDVFG